jgi:predicted dehydrogenase
LWETDPPTPVTHAGALAMVPQVELVAGSSKGREHLDFFGRRFGVDALYLDYREMFEKEDLDIVAIATPPGLHRDIVTAAVEAGVRGVFCEKPMALDLNDADAIVQICKQAGAVLSVNHTRRWRPEWIKARELLEEGAIGELVSMFGVCQGAKPHPGWEAEEEGPLLHDAVHLFDMFRFYAGDVHSVVGTALKRLQPFRVEDDTQAILEFKGGTSAVALVNELSRYTSFGIELHGTEGVIDLRGRGHRLFTSVQWADHQREVDPEIDWWLLEERSFPPVPDQNPLLSAVQELVHCMETGARPSSTGEDGVASVEMVMALYESQLQGNVPVTLPLSQRDSALYRLREAGQL